MLLVKNAIDIIDVVIDDINKFFKTDWLAYRKLVENLKLSSFKDYEKLE